MTDLDPKQVGREAAARAARNTKTNYFTNGALERDILEGREDEKIAREYIAGAREMLARMGGAEGRVFPIPCFTCGSEATAIIRLDKGCAALPEAVGVFGVCAQHAYSVDPIGDMEQIYPAAPAPDGVWVPRELVEKLVRGADMHPMGHWATMQLLGKDFLDLRDILAAPAEED